MCSSGSSRTCARTSASSRLESYLRLLSGDNQVTSNPRIKSFSLLEQAFQQQHEQKQLSLHQSKSYRSYSRCTLFFLPFEAEEQEFSTWKNILPIPIDSILPSSLHPSHVRMVVTTNNFCLEERGEERSARGSTVLAPYAGYSSPLSSVQFWGDGAPWDENIYHM